MRIASIGVVLLILAHSLESCSGTEEISVPEANEVLFFSDSTLLKPNLKILDIGNSYTDDATAYLPYLIDKLDADVKDVCLYKAVLAGGSYKYWYKVYHDQFNRGFEVKKVIGELEANVEEGAGSAYDGRLFRALLGNETWDVVIIHPLSNYATNYEGWWGRGEGGYLKELLELIEDNQPNCTIGYLLVHSPSDDYSTNAEHSSLLRWEHIANATQQLVQDCNIRILIPYGTSIQNLRETEYNNDIELTRDGNHLGYGLARYTAACCYYETLLSYRTGVSVLGKNIPYPVEEKPERSQYSVTMENMGIAQKAAVLACFYPYTCINPNDFENGYIVDY